MLYFLYYTTGQILYFHSAVLNQSVYMTSYRKLHAFLSLVDTELQVILIVY